MALAVPRLREGRLDDADALIALRQLGVVFVGLTLALGIDGAEEVVLLCRIVGGLCALVVVGVVLVGRARADAAGQWALLALVTAAAALTLLLRMLDVGPQNEVGALAWPVVGGLAGGIAIGARVSGAVGGRAVQRSKDAYALHLQRRRGNPLAPMAPLARPMLAIGAGGLGAFVVFGMLLELFHDPPWAALGLIASVCVLIVPLTMAAVLMAMPLFGADGARGHGRLRGIWTRSSGVQPLANLVGSAIASLITIASGPSRPPGLGTSTAASRAPDPPARARRSGADQRDRDRL